MSDKLTWETTPGRIGPETTFGLWEGVKVFSVYAAQAPHKDASGVNRMGPAGEFVFKCDLPGWHNKELPRQSSIAAAKTFAERTLTRWVAKRGLLFKDNIVVTDAMAKAAEKMADEEGSWREPITVEAWKQVIKAALEARG